MKRFAISTLAAISLAAPALAIESDHMIKKVDVTFDLQAVDSVEAAKFWGDLEGDLESAIVALVTNNIGETGSEISVDVDEFDMTNSFQGALGVDSSLMAGIEIKNEDDPTKNSFFDLRLTVDESGAFKTSDDGMEIVAHDREAVYDTMVNGFATALVERLR